MVLPEQEEATFSKEIITVSGGDDEKVRLS